MIVWIMLGLSLFLAVVWIQAYRDIRRERKDPPGK